MTIISNSKKKQQINEDSDDFDKLMNGDSSPFKQQRTGKDKSIEETKDRSQLAAFDELLDDDLEISMSK